MQRAHQFLIPASLLIALVVAAACCEAQTRSPVWIATLGRIAANPRAAQCSASRRSARRDRPPDLPPLRRRRDPPRPHHQRLRRSAPALHVRAHRAPSRRRCSRPSTQPATARSPLPAPTTSPSPPAPISSPIRSPITVAPLSNLAVTVHLDEPPAPETSHPGSRATAYYVHGDQASAATLQNPGTIEHWYQVSEIDVQAPTGAGVIVGPWRFHHRRPRHHHQRQRPLDRRARRAPAAVRRHTKHRRAQ